LTYIIIKHYGSGTSYQYVDEFVDSVPGNSFAGGYGSSLLDCGKGLKNQWFFADKLLKEFLSLFFKSRCFPLPTFIFVYKDIDKVSYNPL